ncbi:hypothetical protein JN11_03326 [Mucilaginibacter frigoritolerans]|uniref:Uncharacterized protein n=1 Tax=Mucilaginibacter frigoritolerans TaxID=652788 RepID=A0A562TVD5_9SPHI|nr:hypothetical protein JN11_03326 [Mucilaginibacter frigoritolerans]
MTEVRKVISLQKSYYTNCIILYTNTVIGLIFLLELKNHFLELG